MILNARAAVQATCEKFYNHRYYLSPGQQKKFDPLEVIEEADEAVVFTNESKNFFDTSSEPPIKKLDQRSHISGTTNICYLQDE